MQTREPRKRKELPRTKLRPVLHSPYNQQSSSQEQQRLRFGNLGIQIECLETIPAIVRPRDIAATVHNDGLNRSSTDEICNRIRTCKYAGDRRKYRAKGLQSAIAYSNRDAHVRWNAGGVQIAEIVRHQIGAVAICHSVTIRKKVNISRMIGRNCLRVFDRAPVLFGNIRRSYLLETKGLDGI